jgi:adenylate kinase
MADLKKEVQALLKGLKSLTKQTEKMVKKVDSLTKAKPKKAKAKKAKVKKAKAKKVKRAVKKKARPARKKVARKKVARKKVAAKAARVPASDVVYKLVKRNKKGIDTASLIKKTGYKEKKIRDIIYRLKKQRKIKSAKKGIYVTIG